MFVELTDVTTNYVYEVEVTEEEALRVQNDYAFAQQLLEEAKVRGDERNVEQDEYNEIPNKKKTHIWAYTDIVILIDSVSSHYEEIKHNNPKIKKKGWKNILNDLLSANVSLTIADIKKKWSNPVQSYNKAKDIHNKSGGTPSRFNFFEKIDDILGDKANNCSPHSFDSGNISESVIRFSEEPPQESQSISDDQSIQTDGCASLPSVRQLRKRNTPAAQYLLIKKRYLNNKEDLLERRQERQRKLELLSERNIIEARKAKALEDLVELKRKGE
ncbi:unnamed protein product [Psylliodes chrysocephalus]|uniref:Myb/SANT-like DNA-binding domain-containing protein n=1 Tax=Psylliodes chrysocephalus TaxID=3402493 RepID=A0A9P0D4Y5_9CUCU|nr:unnamed protein product [Psylliodes chrysocephala]